MSDNKCRTNKCQTITRNTLNDKVEADLNIEKEGDKT